ncbi:MAG: 16S rRNA (cytidine(1402)-2'-O)-methyltransferase [Paracoccaceae bacterium]
MSAEIRPLAPGLYFVATPIGTARDITLRALDILASADVIAAEDTRTARHLMEIHGIALGDRPVVAYHDHNGAAVRPRLLKALADGKSVAYVSEAGTPMVADPGFVLAREAIAAGHPVTSAPGPSAAITALTLAGLPTDRFLFAGFAPNAGGARRAFLRELADIPATLVLYESPKRIHQSLKDMALELGAERQAAICRELTKKFEEVIRAPLGELVDQLADRTLKGEIVVVIDRNRQEASEDTMVEALKDALLTLSVKDAAQAVSDALGLPRRKVYQTALELEKKK